MGLFADWLLVVLIFSLLPVAFLNYAIGTRGSNDLFKFHLGGGRGGSGGLSRIENPERVAEQLRCYSLFRLVSLL